MIWDAFKGAIKWAMDKALPLMTGAGLIGLLIAAVQDSYCWIVAQAMTWLAAFVGMVAGYIPPPAVDTIAAVSGYFPVMAAWFPIGFVFRALIAYQVFALAVIVYRFIKSWIPSVSG